METNSTVQMNRVQSIDIVKGIAIICIILGHLDIPAVNKVVFTFNVPIFYFISGYFINTKTDFRSFVKRKARTLLVPYYITSLVIIFFSMLEGLQSGNALLNLKEWTYAALYASGHTYTEPFYIKQIGAIWFLWATFWGAVFLRMTLNMKKTHRIFTIAALFTFGYLSKKWFWFPLSIQAGACAAFFMYLGYLVQKEKQVLSLFSDESKHVITIISLVVWLSFIIHFKSFWLVRCVISGVQDIIGCICASYIVFLIARLIEEKIAGLGKVLAYIGKYSLLVLCIHIVELDMHLFSWTMFSFLNLSAVFQKAMTVAAKLIFDLFGAYVLSGFKFIRWMFGYRE